MRQILNNDFPACAFARRQVAVASILDGWEKIKIAQSNIRLRPLLIL